MLSVPSNSSIFAPRSSCAAMLSCAESAIAVRDRSGVGKTSGVAEVWMRFKPAFGSCGSLKVGPRTRNTPSPLSRTRDVNVGGTFTKDHTTASSPKHRVVRTKMMKSSLALPYCGWYLMCPAGSWLPVRQNLKQIIAPTPLQLSCRKGSSPCCPLGLFPKTPSS